MIYVPIWNPILFANNIIGVQCSSHPWTDHVKPIQHTFTKKHKSDTKVHILITEKKLNVPNFEKFNIQGARWDIAPDIGELGINISSWKLVK